ncbi:MAG: hypothetical protein U9M90_02820 [Patescibacteria group bacterium]|nr:hypothetical protein [Patescibacteria group bacterium]
MENRKDRFEIVKHNKEKIIIDVKIEDLFKGTSKKFRNKKIALIDVILNPKNRKKRSTSDILLLFLPNNAITKKYPGRKRITKIAIYSFKSGINISLLGTISSDLKIVWRYCPS